MGEPATCQMRRRPLPRESYAGARSARGVSHAGPTTLLLIALFSLAPVDQRLERRMPPCTGRRALSGCRPVFGCSVAAHKLLCASHVLYLAAAAPWGEDRLVAGHNGRRFFLGGRTQLAFSGPAGLRFDVFLRLPHVTMPFPRVLLFIITGHASLF